ncbi:uncharacterized protein METZ01_LOCUS130488 [marine metagenome]|uniref:Uncharacterized protein n=1 Tax=marine metagenome TaxID=408172 RepID=A0A381YKS8_9ZZZZ
MPKVQESQLRQEDSVQPLRHPEAGRRQGIEEDPGEEAQA